MYENEEHGGAREQDPDTSHDAARKVRPLALQIRIVKILEYVGHGLITHEMADLEKIVFHGQKPHGWGSFSPRIKKMVEKGLLYDTGEKRKDRGGTDRGPSNSDSIVRDLCSRRPEEVPAFEPLVPRPFSAAVQLEMEAD